ncbi:MULTISPECIES: AAA family ATPase [unclassified Hahella]|uniref:AAA family ATPase n=1 Tax=unclassified Hahella TaxID=2624107 RepID=UPI001C1ED410|nr:MULTISPECIES: AAA family ATPase [unclassified Hahella]MBU6952847.1 AAA family ATPase [Hahella sp. HN01]MDG9670198.1 AAA family ATPase [Hahella sp. CR1]
MPEVHDLGLMIDSRIPLIVIQSHEETRVLDTVTRLAIKKSLPLFAWTVTDGLKRMGFGFDLEQEDKLKDPEKILEHIKRSHTASIFVLCDYHPYLDDEPKHIRLLKDIALTHRNNGHTVILLSHTMNIPGELKHLSANFKMRLPNADQLINIVREEAARWSQQHYGEKVKTDNKTLQQLVRNMSGVTFEEARRLARGAIFDDGAITQSDIPEVNRAKFELMEMEGVLSFEYDTAKFTDVGGLESLKKWLQQRRVTFVEGKSEAQLDPPKGIMLLGVQGGGKSLAAKAVAGMWGLPLLRMDMGALYNKFFGETERNMREALQLAELMSPCVLWIDEIEKGLGQDGNDQGVSKRVLGTLLTWMSENKHPVFLVATANNIKSLPPELMRKGRIDEIFFVDLPTLDVRQIIFDIHLQKRGLSPANFDAKLLAESTDGFTGAEIEQAVVSALYSAAALGQPLTTELVLEEISNTQPLSVVMAEDMLALRAWAAARCVPAD